VRQRHIGLTYLKKDIIIYRAARYGLGANEEQQMHQPQVEKEKAELEEARLQLDVALRAWDDSVAELWRI
jgi:hypothetical protein